MVEIKIIADEIQLEILGLHKVWALKSHLSVPLSGIRSIVIDPQLAARPLGWKAPGTYIPRMITAGTFYHDKKRWFWDVSNPNNAIVIEVEGEKYQMLVVEVEKPNQVVGRIKAALE